MTRRQRLDRIEAALSPLQQILAWAAEVSEHPSLNDYVLSVRDGPDPLTRILRVVAGSTAATATLGAQAPKVESAGPRLSSTPTGTIKVLSPRRRVIRDTTMLFFLVLRLNEVLRVRGQAVALALTTTLLSHYQFYDAPILALKSGYDFEQDVRDNGPAFWATWLPRARDAIEAVDILLMAKANVQDRYFGGQSVLFADTAEVEETLIGLHEELGALLDGSRGGRRTRSRKSQPTTEERDPTPFEALVGAVVREIRDDARAEAMRRLGETAAARAVVEAQLRWRAS